MNMRVVSGVVVILLCMGVSVFAQSEGAKEDAADPSAIIKSVMGNPNEDSFDGLSYQTFLDYVAADKVKSVKFIDGPGLVDMKATVLKDGKESVYTVKKPYQASEDPILIKFLDEHKVSHEAVVDMSMEKLGTASSMVFFGLLTAIVPVFIAVFLLAMLVLLIVILVRVSKVEKALQILTSAQNARARESVPPPIH